MNEVFERNIDSIRENLPELWKSLETEIEKFRLNPKGDDEEKFEWVQKPGRSTNLFYFRKSPRFQGLYHAEDSLKEVEEIFKKADLRYPQFTIFFGPGLGHLSYHFFANRPTHNFAMVIVEKNPQIFIRSLCLYDFCRLFEDDTVIFLVGKPIAVVKSSFNPLFQRFGTVDRSIKILASPVALETESEYYREIAANLLKIRDTNLITGGNSVDDSFIGFKNICGNAKTALKNTGVQAFFGKRKELHGKAIVSVAAGPSTEEHWDRLYEIQGKVPIITCDVMLRPMLKRGIVPDFVTALERVSEVTDYFRGVKIPERTRLIGPLLLLPESIEAFQGESYLYCPTVQQAQGMGFDYLGMFYPGGSAGNLNVFFSALMGFSHIIMVGHNLAYGYDKLVSHIHGTGFEEQDRVLSEDELLNNPTHITQDGLAQVKTTTWWQLFRHHMEITISSNPEINFINTAPKGARIEGATLMSFDEALKTYAHEDFDIYDFFKEVRPEVSHEQVQHRFKRVKHKLTEGIQQMEKWYAEGQRIFDCLNLWEEEIQIAEEKNSPVDLDYLDKRIDEVLSVKVQSVNEDKVFYEYVITTILPAHVTFEREVNEMPMNYTDNYKLKRDFLLAHKRYFKVWLYWFPRMIEELKKLDKDLAAYEKELGSAEHDDLKADAVH